MKLTLVTSNRGKLEEFRSALAPLDVEVQHSEEECDEIQADTLREVVLSCLDQLEAKRLKDIVIDDSGLFVHALDGFPGVYSSYVLRTIGMDGILRLLDGKDDRSAHFECCIGASLGGRRLTVTGRSEGTIARGALGNRRLRLRSHLRAVWILSDLRRNINNREKWYISPREGHPSLRRRTQGTN